MSKSWGKELWDQLSALEKHTEKGIEFLDKYSTFVKERQKIEMDYASQLKKLVRGYSPKKKEEEDYQNYSSLRTFKGVLQEVGSIANQHELISDYLGKDVLMEVVRLIAELKKERKEHLQEAKHEENVMDKSKKKLDSCKSAYRAAHEQWMQAKILFEKADSDDNRTKAEVERARSTMDNKNKMREDQKNDYILQLQNTNKDQEEHYYKKVPTIFNKLQTMEERRITCLGKYYETYAECHKKVLPVITQCLDDIQTKHGQSVKPAEDSQAVVAKFETGIRPPPDIVMVDLDEPGSSLSHSTPDKSGDNISIGSQNGGANSLPGRGKPPKKRTGIFGTMFTKKGGKRWEETKDFSHLPPNQQKQKLQKKIDEIQGKIDVEVKEKEALLKMRDVYTANSSLGDPNSVNKRLEEIGRKIDVLRLELNTYQSGDMDKVEKLSRQKSRDYEVPEKPPDQKKFMGYSPYKRNGRVVEYKDKADGKIAPQTTPQTTPQKVSPSHSSSGRAPIVTSVESNSPSNDRPVSSPLSPLEHGDSFFDEDDDFDDIENDAEPSVGKCTAVYEFESEDPNLLNMRENEVLDVIEADSGDGWTRVRRSDKTEGYVPTSYIKS
ncbi:formin-binding protein 1-like isoform X3 [Apostichopus japonicus]|uniref:formin-binding protein 1-like isoform X3 n=1 Tax=Stichopus japonicus TaxID=307972 RepID=UPI003AB328A7